MRRPRARRESRRAAGVAAHVRARRSTRSRNRSPNARAVDLRSTTETRPAAGRRRTARHRARRPSRECARDRRALPARRDRGRHRVPVEVHEIVGEPGVRMRRARPCRRRARGAPTGARAARRPRPPARRRGRSRAAQLRVHRGRQRDEREVTGRRGHDLDRAGVALRVEVHRRAPLRQVGRAADRSTRPSRRRARRGDCRAVPCSSRARFVNAPIATIVAPRVDARVQEVERASGRRRAAARRSARASSARRPTSTRSAPRSCPTSPRPRPPGSPARPASRSTYDTQPARVPPSSRLVVMPTISTPGHAEQQRQRARVVGVAAEVGVDVHLHRAIIPGPSCRARACGSLSPCSSNRRTRPRRPPTNASSLLRYLHRQREEVVAAADGLTDDDGALDARRAAAADHRDRQPSRARRVALDRRPLPRPRVPAARRGVPRRRRRDARRRDRRLRRTGRADRRRSCAPRRASRSPCLGGEGRRAARARAARPRQPLDLRWAVLHLIEETARHAGHADATREMLDGRTKIVAPSSAGEVPRDPDRQRLRGALRGSRRSPGARRRSRCACCRSRRAPSARPTG